MNEWLKWARWKKIYENNVSNVQCTFKYFGCLVDVVVYIQGYWSFYGVIRLILNKKKYFSILISL